MYYVCIYQGYLLGRTQLIEFLVLWDCCTLGNCDNYLKDQKSNESGAKHKILTYSEVRD